MVVDLPASVAARLLNQSKRTGGDYQTLLAAYGFERFLYRLGQSGLRDRFILKGAMLLRVWSDRPYRATRDLGLLRRGDVSFEAIREDIRAISAMPVEADGFAFEADAVRIEAIRAEDEHAGMRAILPGAVAQPDLSCRSTSAWAMRWGPRLSVVVIRCCCSIFRRRMCWLIPARRW
jgi:hypothetical protein